MSTEIQKELSYIYESGEFVLGEHIYMGMGLANGHRVCMSVAYKIDYCIKKALQFEMADNNVKLTHINKIRIGELEACKRFYYDEAAMLN